MKPKLLNSQRREVRIGKNSRDTLQMAAEHWVETARSAISERGRFAVALSGGTTPHAIYELLKSPVYATRIDWSKVWLFWSDERAVAPVDPESNYRAAMQSFSHLSIPKSQIIRMEAETNIEKNASDYEEKIIFHLGSGLFDLVMLGIGEDGHTASLFPDTPALEVQDRLCVANYVPSKNSWRMTLTFLCINTSRLAVIYALGESKKDIVQCVLQSPLPTPWPASYIGSEEHKVLWILDAASAKSL